MDTHWTASALFSPSKAAVQRAQAKDWAAVDGWLARRYGARMPTFERNEETLQALLTLANLNESAEEQRTQIERIEKTAYQALSKRQTGINEEVISTMLLELANETHLDTLAETAVESDCPSSDITMVAGGIVELIATQFEMTEQVKRIEAQVRALRKEQDRSRRLLQELRGNSFQANGDLIEATFEWQKTTKHLRAKIAEYEDRLSPTRLNTASHNIKTIQQTYNDISLQRTQLTLLEGRIRAYQNLPTEPRAARRKLEETQDQLQKLIYERDNLFGNTARDQ